MFQFLNGTIITTAVQTDANGRTMFQFLNGTIITTKENPVTAQEIMFQFLNGTIITCSNHFQCRTSHCVSIPQWYDYNPFIAAK